MGEADDNSNGLEFDDFNRLELHTNKHQANKVKAFADQRRAVKPNRKHAASRNPVKVLQSRQEVERDGDEDDELKINEEDLEGLDEAEQAELAALVGETGGVSERNDRNRPKAKDNIKLVSRHPAINAGKVQGPDVALAADAKKGLETKVDVSAASKSLRVTEKDSKTGVGTEKTNIYDGVKPVMLFHIKGARHIQMRLVEPSCGSLNSGDVFVLVTPKYVHQWNGKNCSIMEKARGSEVSAVVHQWKELGCQAVTANVMDEGREKPTTETRAFWKALKGSASDIKEVDDVLDDKIFEKGILEANMFYEVNASGDDDDASCWLEVLKDYSGKVPSKKWLDPTKAYVLDFGTEVYSWIGRQCQGAPRKQVAEIGLKHFNDGFKTDAAVHPYQLNGENKCPGKKLARPSWAVYGRMAEKTENVAFRRKFFDWPDPVDLKVKTIDAKVHAQLTSEFSNGDAQQNLLPVRAKDLMAPTEEPLMVLDGNFIGRGKGMQDMETLFKYGVNLNSLKIWQVSGNELVEVPQKTYGTFYSAEAYVINWSFEIFRTGIRHLKGGDSKQEDRGSDKNLLFFWQGKDCSASDKGAAALMLKDLGTEEGSQILVPQGKEPPAFFQLFDGKMIVHAGKAESDTKYVGIHMYWIRNEVECELCLWEVPLSSGSLRSRGSFLVADQAKSALYLWHGSKSTGDCQVHAMKATTNFSVRLRDVFGKTFKVLEMLEGEEVEEFWDALGDEKDYVSYMEVSKSFNFTPRCFAFDSLHGHFRATELTSSAYSPGLICAFPVLQADLYELSQPALVFVDAKHKMYLWQGWWPIADEELNKSTGPNTGAEKHRFDVNRKLAMETIREYSESVGRKLSRAYIVYAGMEPIEFQNLFPVWEPNGEVAALQRELGIEDGTKRKLGVVLEQLSKDEYSLDELMQRPLPEGVDPTRIEDYLNKVDFKKLFGVPKDEFPKLPRWKQIDLKKKAQLF